MWTRSVGALVSVLAWTASATTTAESNGTTLDFTTLPGSEGLCSPRKLAALHNVLYVANSGIGGVTPDDRQYCALERGFLSCMGPTSSVSAFSLATTGAERREVVTNLFSSRIVEGVLYETQSTGAHHAVPDATRYDQKGQPILYVVVGLGMNATELRRDGIEQAVGAFGAVLEANLYQQMAMPWVYPWEDEYANDYDSSGDDTDSGILPVPNSNPYHLLIRKNKFYVIDAGANAVLIYQRKPNGWSETGEDPVVLVLPKLSSPTNPEYEVEFVPTALATRPGHDNQLYISALAGAPWTEPVAQLFQVDLDHDGYPKPDTLRVVPGGPYYAIADFSFADADTIYILETNPGVPFIPFAGRLSKVTLHDNDDNEMATSVTVETTLPLVAPSGIVVYNHAIYITNRTFTPSGFDGTCTGHIVVAALPKKGPEKKSGKKEKSSDDDKSGKKEKSDDDKGGKKETKEMSDKKKMSDYDDKSGKKEKGGKEKDASGKMKHKSNGGKKEAKSDKKNGSKGYY